MQKRRTIPMHQSLWDLIDTVAKQLGETRHEFIAEAVSQRIHAAGVSDPRNPPADNTAGGSVGIG